MTKEQQEVINWWHGGRNYHSGIMLLSRFGKPHGIIRALNKAGKEKFQHNHAKLHYELPKAVGLTKEQAEKGKAFAVDGSAFQPAPDNLRHTERSRSAATFLPTDNPTTFPDNQQQYPYVIRRLKYEYSDLYNQRSIGHKEMTEVPEANSTKNTNARAALLGQIKAISGKMEFLYGFIGAYEQNGTIPLEDEVWPPKKEAAGLPDDAEELKKLKKNLQTYNTKNRNLLQYQGKTKGDKQQPMPDGPKRQRIELRIKTNENMVSEIDKKLWEIEKE